MTLVSEAQVLLLAYRNGLNRVHRQYLAAVLGHYFFFFFNILSTTSRGISNNVVEHGKQIPEPRLNRFMLTTSFSCFRTLLGQLVPLLVVDFLASPAWPLLPVPILVCGSHSWLSPVCVAGFAGTGWRSIRHL